MERTASEEPRPVEVAGVQDTPDTPDTSPKPIGTPPEALALYRRPADPQSGKGEAGKAQAGQAQAEQAQDEQDQDEQAPDEQAQAGQAQAEQTQAEQTQAERTQAGQTQAESDGAENAEGEPEHANARYLEPEERHRIGPDYADPTSWHPSMEIDPAEYALPPHVTKDGHPEPCHAGHPGSVSLDTLFQNGDGTHPRNPGRRLPRAALAVTGAALALVGLGGIVVSAVFGVTAGPTPLAATADEPGPAKPTRSPTAVVTGARDGRTSATFEFLSSATRVDMRVDDLGDQLFRITTPAGSTVRPAALLEGDGVRLALTPTGHGNRPVAIGVVLNADVRWTLRIAGGLRVGTFDLRGGTVAAVDLAGGAGRLDLSLPRPDGTLSVRMSGGVNLFRLATVDEVPVRVTARAGAGQIVLDGTATNGVARGASFRSPGWSDETDRIDVDAVAGFGTLRVSHDEAP